MFKSILCPVDPAEPGLEQKALAAARLLAAADDARLTLLGVVPDVPTIASEYLPPDFRDTQMNEARSFLFGLVETLGLPDGRVEVHIRKGRPYHEILEEAASMPADLIVMASHQPRLATYLIGSNAAHVVRHSTCSVMVLRPEAA